MEGGGGWFLFGVGILICEKGGAKIFGEVDLGLGET